MYNPQDGLTAMSMAVRKGHKDIIEILKTSQSKVRCTIIRSTLTVEEM